MKKLLAILAALFAFAAAAVSFASDRNADEAEEFAKKCRFTLSDTYRKPYSMIDRNFSSAWSTATEREHPWVQLTAPEGRSIHGLYICFQEMPDAWEIQKQDANGEWVRLAEGDTRFYHVYVPVNGGADTLRLYTTSDRKTKLGINEIYAFDKGVIPDWVQRWEPTPTKTDILFLSAHPDDELIFMGGAIPTYAAERKRPIAVAYFTYGNQTRRSELLNGLWSIGCRYYPVLGPFEDTPASKFKDAYEAVSKDNGEEQVLKWLTGVIRRVRPEVIVTHDINGEYGHKQHKLCADAAIKCFDLAASKTFKTGSGKGNEPWQVKKLYLHLYGNHPIVFDWNVPLTSMGGKTGLELADLAYKTCHKSQLSSSSMNVRTTGEKYPNTTFGLYRSTVGDDIFNNDFLENIGHTGSGS